MRAGAAGARQSGGGFGGVGGVSLLVAAGEVAIGEAAASGGCRLRIALWERADKDWGVRFSRRSKGGARLRGSHPEDGRLARRATAKRVYGDLPARASKFSPRQLLIDAAKTRPL